MSSPHVVMLPTPGKVVHILDHSFPQSDCGNYDVTWIRLGLLPLINFFYFILYPSTPNLVSLTTEYSAEYFIHSHNTTPVSS